jgi:hypothetical protein
LLSSANSAFVSAPVSILNLVLRMLAECGKEQRLHFTSWVMCVEAIFIQMRVINKQNIQLCCVTVSASNDSIYIVACGGR